MSLYANFAAFAHGIWRKTGIISTCLLPLSWLTARAIVRKRQRYLDNPELAWRAPVPVIVVGNIFIGGTGKTPVVIALVQALRQRGWNPGVVSRGYGVQTGAAPRVTQGTPDPAQFGDEPALIARITSVPIAVHPRRKLAGQALLKAHPEVDVIISDDGLQHLELARDLEVVVQDERGTGNGRLLPAGPLREPENRLSSVDFLVTQRLRLPKENNQNSLATGPVRLSMSMVPVRVIHLVTSTEMDWKEWVAAHAQNHPGAAAAIGNPHRFFDMLRLSGLAPSKVLPLPDHYAYQVSPFGLFGEAPILITPKDAVKCLSLADSRLWSVQTETRFSAPDWLDDVHQRIQSIRSAQASLPDKNA